jgi:hypothetical protein
MNDSTPQHPDSQSKVCVRCKQNKPLTDFYTRSGLPHLHNSECKACMKARYKDVNPVPATEPRAKSEILAINELKRQGIHAAPGKSVAYADVDVVAFGCVRIEVKYAKLNTKFHRECYTFRLTPKQKQRGLLADIVMLICDDGTRCTFHLFQTSYQAFYMTNGALKTGFDFVPGQNEQLKHHSTRTIMTQAMMDEAHNRWGLVWSALKAQSDALKQEGA